MDDNLKRLYDNVSREFDLPDFDTFKADMQDSTKLRRLYDTVGQTFDLPDYETFVADMGLKKKVPSELSPLPSVEDLQKNFQERQKKSGGFSVVPPQPIKTNYEDTLPEDITIEAVNKADKSRMDYLSGEAKKIEAGVIERVKQEAAALSKKYQGPELEQKLYDLYELRSGEMQKAVETLAGEAQYKYIDKDVKNYSDLFGNILDSNNTHGQKVQQIADLRQNILNSIPEEGRAVVKGELNRLISDLATQSPMGQQFLLKTSVATTRDKLMAAHDKLKAETEEKMRGVGIDPTAIATALPMFEKEVDELSRLQGAIDFMNRALDVPESKEGAIGDAFKSELGNILTAGLSGLLENLEVMQSARKENPTEADKALVDAYGQLQQLQGMASENVDRFRRAKSLVGSIPYMEQFLLTGGVGDFASATAKKVGESVLKRGIKSRIAQGITKRLIEPVTEGAISMIGRVPIMPMTYQDITEAGIAIKEEDGKFVVDPAQMPTIGEAIGKGVYKSATEVFSESLGGVFALPKWKWIDKVITPSAKKLFTRVGMQNPFGEYGEEIFANLFQGEKIDREFLGDLLMTIPIMTGGFAVLSTPAIVKDLKMAKKEVPSAPVVENLIEAKDEKGLLDLVTKAVTGKTKAEAIDIVEGVGAMVQENVADEMTAKVDAPTEKVVGKNGNTYTPEILIRESGKDKVRVLNNNGEEVSSLTMRTVDVDGEKYWSVIQLATATGEENNGLATAVYRQALNNLPEGYVGIISPGESRINKTEVPRVHQKLAAEFDMEVKDNGDIVFKRPNGASDIAPRIEGKTESGTQVSPGGDMPTPISYIEPTEGGNGGGITPEAGGVVPIKYAVENHPDLKFLEEDLPSKKPAKKDRVDISDIEGEFRIRPIVQKIKTKGTDDALRSVVANDENRPVMQGVFYDAENQVKIASDAKVLISIPEKISGKSRIVNPKTKQIVEGAYPNYQSVIPDNANVAPINISEVLNSVTGIDRANAFVDSFGIGISAKIEYDDTSIEFDPEVLKKGLLGLMESGTTNARIELPDNTTRAIVIRDADNPKKFALVMPIMPNPRAQTVLKVKTNIDPEIIKERLGALKSKPTWGQTYHAEQLKKAQDKNDEFSIEYHTEQLAKANESLQNEIKSLEAKLSGGVKKEAMPAASTPAPQTQEEVPETTNAEAGTIAETAQVQATPLKVEEESKVIPLNDVQEPEAENEGGAKEALQNYLANWAENTLRVKDNIMREIREDYDMVLTKLKNMDLIKTDCV